jgi:putative ABC transport system permease protein
MKFLHLVWRNLMRRRIRTFITLVTIIIGFLLFGVLMAIRAAFTLGVEVAGADRLVMIHKVSFIQLLPLSYQARIASVEGVKGVTHQTWLGAYYQDPGNFFANIAVDPEPFLAIYPEVEVPADQAKNWYADRTGAIIGVDLARRFNWKIGDRIPMQGTFFRPPDGRPWEFTIRGIYDSTAKGFDKTQLFFNYKYLEETIQEARGSVGWYVIRVADPATADRLATRIDSLFANSPAETKTATEKQFVQAFAGQIGDIGAIMMAISGVAMVFILLITANTMAQSIRERTSELGVMKTLGFTEGRILSLVLLESTVVAFLGGGIGLALAWALTSMGDPTGGFLPAFYFPVRDLITGVGMVTILGFATGIVPGVQASRLKIVDALRRTG